MIILCFKFHSSSTLKINEIFVGFLDSYTSNNETNFCTFPSFVTLNFSISNRYFKFFTFSKIIYVLLNLKKYYIIVFTVTKTCSKFFCLVGGRVFVFPNAHLPFFLIYCDSQSNLTIFKIPGLASPFLLIFFFSVFKYKFLVLEICRQ